LGLCPNTPLLFLGKKEAKKLNIKKTVRARRERFFMSKSFEGGSAARETFASLIAPSAKLLSEPHKLFWKKV
jgi:hypothetical protein